MANMTEIQRTILEQVADGIDGARAAGVVAEYPSGVIIDGEWVAWPPMSQGGEAGSKLA